MHYDKSFRSYSGTILVVFPQHTVGLARIPGGPSGPRTGRPVPTSSSCHLHFCPFITSGKLPNLGGGTGVYV